MPNRFLSKAFLFALIVLAVNSVVVKAQKAKPAKTTKVVKNKQVRRIETASNIVPEVIKTAAPTTDEPKNTAEVSEAKPTATSETPATTEPETSAAPKTATTNSQPNAPAPLTRIGVQTGQTLPITLTEAIRRALENNNSIEVARNDVKISESTLRSLQGFYDPVFSISPNYRRNIQPQPTTLGGAGSTGTTESSNFTVNSSFTQFIQRGGGTITGFFDNDRGSTNSSFSTLNPSFSTSLGVSFTQPLWRNRTIDNTRRNIKIQRKRLEQSDADFRRQTIDVISQVQRAYWDLVFALRDQQNRVDNLNLSKENLRLVLARIDAGTVAPIQRAETETEIANRETDVLLAAQSVTTAENTLKQLLLKDATANEWQLAIVPTDQPNFDNTPVSLDDALKEAQTNRPELRRLKLQKEINAIDINFFKNQTKPQIDFTSSFSPVGLAGTSTGFTGTTSVPLIAGDPTSNANAFLLQQIQRLSATPIVIPNVTVNSGANPNFVGGYTKSLSNLFRFNTYSYSVGVTINFPLRNTTAKANLAGAKYQETQIEAQTRSQEQTIVAEVRNAVQSVETARQRISTARRARENAEIQLKGEQELYKAGRSTTFLLFQRENTLTNARNAEIRAQTDYNKALADLQRATSTTLQTYNIVID